ncbi:MAG TPA: lactococcin 972 family bacteriocin [Ruminiclostridium sp.]|nr:lactococcin 972 family bacteriocin [Ruminiclostridium sp.]
MKKVLATIIAVLTLSVFGSVFTAMAEVTPEGLEWNHGSYLSTSGKVAYSNGYSSYLDHATTAEISGNHNNSGRVYAGSWSYASIAGYIWDTAYAYYHIY